VTERESAESTTVRRSCPYESDWLREAWEEGYREDFLIGMARGLFRAIDSRGLAISDEERDRITSCTDPERLAEWGRRVTKVEKVEDLFQ
jgi:hypothetical protein